MGSKSKFKRHIAKPKTEKLLQTIQSHVQGKCIGIQDGMKISRIIPSSFSIILHREKCGLACGIKYNTNLETLVQDHKEKKIIGYAFFNLKDNKYVLESQVNMPTLPLKEMELGKIILTK